MTVSENVNAVLKKAYDEIGYLEKSKKAYAADPSIIWNKTEGAGKDNITKYWEEIKKSFQGGAWCQVFAYWCFLKALGKTKADKALYLDSWDSYEPWGYFATMSWRKNFENHNVRIQTSKAQPGDMVFFKKSHVGIVYKIDDNYLYTIEGNTSGASGVVANGGGVRTKKYKRGKDGVDEVDFYGRPNWSAVSSTSKKKLPVVHKGDKGEAVKYMQELLIKAGYSCGKSGADGSYGGATYKAVMKFQKDHEKEIGASPDGTVGSGTWKALEKAANG
ncbi:MAG: CHAP domain-containing protein [Lachnospiraceae bacterium]|nr:CHAP domain-containing protein [Lachnospiraceae bacterium]